MESDYRDWDYQEMKEAGYDIFGRPLPLPKTLIEYKNGKDRVEIVRPSWDDILLSKALLAAKRSPDAQTQCGCVITDKHHRELGSGYNGFPRDVDDSMLPNMRPSKYPWMIHSEVNAILNCSSRTDDMIAYITGSPCHQCTCFMWQAGVREIVYIPGSHAVMCIDKEMDENIEIMKYLTKGRLKWREYTANIEHVEQLLSSYKDRVGV